ncbi:hypothetical protein AYO38_03120 [bacterium SCGC AG-212-C10]|nr:hypothetical protein AYO38_03120 [bacterium SCGC AG-212-C10]
MIFRHIAAAILLRCPRCFKGPVWRGPMRMHPTCKVCGYRYEREFGYFYGAMYASWFLMMVTVIPVMLVLLFTGKSATLILGVTLPLIFIVAPLAYMYSRVIWMHIDTYFDPIPPWDGTPPQSV